MPEIVNPAMDPVNRRFVGLILREHYRSRTMPPGWSQGRFIDSCRALGVIR